MKFHVVHSLDMWLILFNVQRVCLYLDALLANVGLCFSLSETALTRCLRQTPT